MSMKMEEFYAHDRYTFIFFSFAMQWTCFIFMHKKFTYTHSPTR
jgi:hypothetical protein